MLLNRQLRERLADALHAAASAPTTEELEDAPLLDGWIAVIEHTGHLLLLGTVDGHPTVDGTISTSPVVKIDSVNGYARPLSRWYRLGRPMTQTDPKTVSDLKSPECLQGHPIPVNIFFALKDEDFLSAAGRPPGG